jgi:hypothetical protein
MTAVSRKLKKILIVLSLVLVLSIALFSLGIAYMGGVRVLGLLGIMFFFTFGIIVVLGQLIPAGLLFSSFIQATISPKRRSEAPVAMA